MTQAENRALTKTFTISFSLAEGEYGRDPSFHNEIPLIQNCTFKYIFKMYALKRQLSFAGVAVWPQVQIISWNYSLIMLLAHLAQFLKVLDSYILN